MKSILVFILSLSFAALANDGLNTRLRRVMACQTPGSMSYLEIFHDQAAMFGNPKNPVGYVVYWTTTMGKDTQKTLVLDVPMKGSMEGMTCVLDVKWSEPKGNGVDATSHYNVIVKGCTLSGAPKATMVRQDVYKNGKTESSTTDLTCQVQ